MDGGRSSDGITSGETESSLYSECRLLSKCRVGRAPPHSSQSTARNSPRGSCTGSGLDPRVAQEQMCEFLVRLLSQVAVAAETEPKGESKLPHTVQVVVEKPLLVS